MNTLWVIFLIAACVLSLYSRVKKEAKRKSLADDGAPVFSGIEMATEVQKPLQGTPAAKRPGKPHKESGYFSYEDSHVKVDPVKEVVIPSVPGQEQVSMLSNFDLRQAVVYETVLNNHYINLEN